MDLQDRRVEIEKKQKKLEEIVVSARDKINQATEEHLKLTGQLELLGDMEEEELLGPADDEPKKKRSK